MCIRDSLSGILFEPDLAGIRAMIFGVCLLLLIFWFYNEYDYFLNGEAYQADNPPSIIIFVPVMYEDALERRKIIAPPYSSLLAIRPKGTFL